MFELADKEDIAWVAGIFDADGTIFQTVAHGKYIQPHIRVAMADKDTVDSFDEIVGYGSRCIIEQPQSAKMYRWSIQDKAGVKEFIAAVWPRLSQRRKDKAKEYGLEPHGA